MFRFILPNGQVIVVEASNKGEAARKAQQWVSANISPQAAADPGVLSSLDGGQQVSIGQVQPGETFIPKGAAGSSLPTSTTIPGEANFGVPGTNWPNPIDRDLTLSSSNLISEGPPPPLLSDGSGATVGAGDVNYSNPGGAETFVPPGPFNPGEDSPVVETGLDIQNRPFGSFANALDSRLGRTGSTEGVMGRTYSNAFDRINPAMTVGTRAGLNPAISEAPGSLESAFYENLPNSSSIALDTFRKLQASRGQEGSSEFFNPTLGTQSGNEAFAQARDLGRNAARNKFGSYVANLFGPSDDTFQRRFDQGAARGTPEDIIDFIAKQFGV